LLHLIERLQLGAGALAGCLEVLGRLALLPLLEARRANVQLTSATLLACDDNVVAKQAGQTLNQMGFAHAAVAF